MTKKKKKISEPKQEQEPRQDQDKDQGLGGNGPLEGAPEEEAPVKGAPDEVTELATELEAARTEIEKLNKEYLLKCADLENYKKRLEREKAEHQSFANVELIRALLPAIDNLERALLHSGEVSDPDTSVGKTDTGTLTHGVEITLKDTLSVLARFGLTEVPALAKRFDPEVHESVGHEEDPEHEDGTVIRVLQKGYSLKERLIRPALVVVSSGKGSGGEGGKGPEEAETN